MICCHWNILEGYGPEGIAEGTFSEFTIPNRAALQELLPDACALMEATVDKVMTAPSVQLLDHLNTIGYAVGEEPA